MLTQADLDEAVSESLAKTEALIAEYGEHFMQPIETTRERLMALMAQSPARTEEATGGNNDGLY